jgi:SAM-dependent methyltransferase
MARVLELGDQPLANAFLRSQDEFAEEPTFPLDVYLCRDCALVQLLDVIDPELLFRSYLYVTGTSDTIAQHNQAYARSVAQALDLGSDDLVIEAASNDGSLLRCFQGHGVRTLGVEPAANIAEQARARGVETLDVFFNEEAAREIRASRGAARAVIGNNVLAHVDDPQGFLRGCKALLDETGLVVVEVPYLGPFLERLEYDTVYHEHLCYFSVGPLARLCDAVGLSIVRIDFVPVHGGSLRMYAGHSQVHGGHASDVMRLVEQERGQGMASLERFERFAEEVAEARRTLLELLDRLKAEGRSVAGYGAPAKGNTLLNYCGIDTGRVAYTVDKSPLKVGLYTPGMHLPVLPVSTLLERKPDYVLILAWNFAEEIQRQQQAYREQGGRFIVPIPRAEVI